jgi:hypothetical protein
VYLHARVTRRVHRMQALAAGEFGQGTIEYVGLILQILEWDGTQASDA